MSLFGNKKMCAVLIISVFLIIFLSLFSKTLSMQNYEEPDFSTGTVTASVLNVRSGPATTYGIIAKIQKDAYVRVFGKIGNWYVVQTESDYIGAVSADYIEPVKDEAVKTSAENENTDIQNVETGELTIDEKEVFDLINAEREKAGLKPLEVDQELLNTARLKAKDMVDNSYFSHTSPTYGSPFEMLKNLKITYKAAGENIAGNSVNSAAVSAWMNSQGHKENILNSAYNYTRSSSSKKSNLRQNICADVYWKIIHWGRFPFTTFLVKRDNLKNVLKSVRFRTFFYTIIIEITKIF